MFHPSIAYNDSESESGSESSYSESSSSSIDGQMDAITHWQNAARSAFRNVTSAPLSGPPVGEQVSSENGVGLFNTKLQFEEKRVTHVIMVNSLDRDQVVYPLPTQARLKLPRVYKNVERIDIVQIKFFCGLYAISAVRKNNTLVVDISGSQTTVVVPDGTYTLQQLLVALQAALGVGWTVSFSPVKGRITIAYTAPFSLPFESSLPVFNQNAFSEWGLGWNLGWGGQPVDLSGSSTYTADHFPRLSDDYIYLQLNDTEHMNEVDHTDVEKTGVTQDSTGQVSHYFGKLLLNNFGCWAQTFVESPKTFKPVLGRLERLQFTWTNRHGLVLLGPDAASCDWHMTLRITEIMEVPVADSSLVQSTRNQSTDRDNS
jgi:hypothetical protein